MNEPKIMTGRYYDEGALLIVEADDGSAIAGDRESTLPALEAIREGERVKVYPEPWQIVGSFDAMAALGDPVKRPRGSFVPPLSVTPWRSPTGWATRAVPVQPRAPDHSTTAQAAHIGTYALPGWWARPAHIAGYAWLLGDTSHGAATTRNSYTSP